MPHIVRSITESTVRSTRYRVLQGERKYISRNHRNLDTCIVIC